MRQLEFFTLLNNCIQLLFYKLFTGIIRTCRTIVSSFILTFGLMSVNQLKSLRVKWMQRVMPLRHVQVPMLSVNKTLASAPRGLVRTKAKTTAVSIAWNCIYSKNFTALKILNKRKMSALQGAIKKIKLKKKKKQNKKISKKLIGIDMHFF